MNQQGPKKPEETDLNTSHLSKPPHMSMEAEQMATFKELSFEKNRRKLPSEQIQAKPDELAMENFKNDLNRMATEVANEIFEVIMEGKSAKTPEQITEEMRFLLAEAWELSSDQQSQVLEPLFSIREFDEEGRAKNILSLLDQKPENREGDSKKTIN